VLTKEQINKIVKMPDGHFEYYEDVSEEIKKTIIDEYVSKVLPYLELKEKIETAIYDVYPKEKQAQDHIKWTYYKEIDNQEGVEKIKKRFVWIKGSIAQIKAGKDILKWVG
jgi:hypothetical protein